MRDIAFTVHFTDPPSGPFFVSPSLLFPPSCFRSFTVPPLTPPSPPMSLDEIPFTREESRHPWRHPHEERWNSRININRIPLLLILVADPSRRILTCKQSRTPSNTIVSSRGKSLSTYNRYRVDSVLSNRRLIGIFAIYRQWQNTDTTFMILYSWIRRYMQRIYVHVKKIETELTDFRLE